MFLKLKSSTFVYKAFRFELLCQLCHLLLSVVNVARQVYMGKVKFGVKMIMSDPLPIPRVRV